MPALLTSLTVTTKPNDLGGSVAEWTWCQSERLVIDVKASGATTALPYRWNETTQEWVPSAAGAATIGGTATTETRWDVGGVRARYCMVSSGGATGVWQPQTGSVR